MATHERTGATAGSFSTPSMRGGNACLASIGREGFAKMGKAGSKDYHAK